MTTTLLDSEIRYSPDTQDYDILICGQCVASAHNYSLAEAKRTRLLAERRDEGMYASAAELDGGADPTDGTPGIDDVAPGSPPDLDPAPGRACVNWNSAPLIPVADLHTLVEVAR